MTHSFRQPHLTIRSNARDIQDQRGELTARLQTRRRFGMAATTCLVALGLAASPLHAERRAVGLFDYCGFGTGPANGGAEGGGGGDTVIVSGNTHVYNFIFDISSPVTIAEHDRVIFSGARSRDLKFKRVEDHLAVCNSKKLFELMIEGQYCRAPALSTDDVKNNEIEELRFEKGREIWLSDTLYAAFKKDPKAFYTANIGTPLKKWTVKPFSKVLPDARRPGQNCPRL